MNKAVAEERTRYNDMKSRMQERIQQVYQEGVARKQEAVAKEKAAFGFWVRNQRKMKKKFYAFNEARAESFLQTYSSNTTVGETINSRKDSIPQSSMESNTNLSEQQVQECAALPTCQYKRKKLPHISGLFQSEDWRTKWESFSERYYTTVRRGKQRRIFHVCPAKRCILCLFAA